MTDIRKPAVLSRTEAITENVEATDVRAKFIVVRDSFMEATGSNPQDGFMRWVNALKCPALADYHDLNREVMAAMALADAEVIKAALDAALAEK